MDKVVYKVREVSELLDVSEKTVLRQIRDGQLKAARIGSDYRISLQDLEKYYSNQGGGSLGLQTPPVDEWMQVTPGRSQALPT
jgi:excisionase family DNA binding protein